MQTNIDYRIYSIKCRAESEEWGVSSKIIRKESHFNEDMIVAVVIAINQLQINPKKIRNLNGIRTYGLCFSSAVLYQLSYEDLIGSRPISWVYLNREKKKMKQKTLPDSYDFISAGKRDFERLSVL